MNTHSNCLIDYCYDNIENATGLLYLCEDDLYWTMITITSCVIVQASDINCDSNQKL